ncbi:MAG: hypothetical protein QOH12_231 [Solirubrobacteraceae bacterium]|nr:hypothetical protein [Solirubrobacteraceae bacterium]
MTDDGTSQTPPGAARVEAELTGAAVSGSIRPPPRYAGLRDSVIRAPAFHLAESRLFRRCVDDAGFDWDVVDHGLQDPGRFDEELSELDGRSGV